MRQAAPPPACLLRLVERGELAPACCGRGGLRRAGHAEKAASPIRERAAPVPGAGGARRVLRYFARCPAACCAPPPVCFFALAAGGAACSRGPVGVGAGRRRGGEGLAACLSAGEGVLGGGEDLRGRLGFCGLCRGGSGSRSSPRRVAGRGEGGAAPAAPDRAPYSALRYGFNRDRRRGAGRADRPDAPRAQRPAPGRRRGGAHHERPDPAARRRVASRQAAGGDRAARRPAGGHLPGRRPGAAASLEDAPDRRTGPGPCSSLWRAPGPGFPPVAAALLCAAGGVD